MDNTGHSPLACTNTHTNTHVYTIHIQMHIHMQIKSNRWIKLYLKNKWNEHPFYDIVMIEIYICWILSRKASTQQMTKKILTFMHEVGEKSTILPVWCHGYYWRQDAHEMGGSWLVQEALSAVYGEQENRRGSTQRLRNQVPSKSTTRSLNVILSELGSHQMDAWVKW